MKAEILWQPLHDACNSKPTRQTFCLHTEKRHCIYALRGGTRYRDPQIRSSLTLTMLNHKAHITHFSSLSISISISALLILLVILSSAPLSLHSAALPPALLILPLPFPQHHSPNTAGKVAIALHLRRAQRNENRARRCTTTCRRVRNRASLDDHAAHSRLRVQGRFRIRVST